MKEFEEISPLELKEMLAKNDTVLVDVREQEEFEQRHIEGALNIPLSNFNLEPLKGNKNIVFQCLSGKRSLVACNNCLNQDSALQKFDKIYSLKGGIKAWIVSGLETKEF